jgi:predicted peptidase
MISAFVLALVLTGCAAASAETDRASITCGTQTQRGFVNDNVYHSELGNIHYSSYIPDSYDGSEPYALFITLPGWEGLYFHGVGANMVEDFGPEAIGWNEKMIVISPQLNDWRETSARQTIALTEYLMEACNSDPDRVYLEGYSGGGETGSLVMGMRPELYTAYLMVSSQWDGDLGGLAREKTPVYLVTGEQDSYYGSDSMKNAAAQLSALYEKQGLNGEEIDRLLVLDVKPQSYFTDRGIYDQHGGGMLIAKDETIMGWLFSRQKSAAAFESADGT